jgi:hypothetical protein
MPESRGYAADQFETPTFVPGAKGMQWSKSADQLDPEECLLRQNCVQYQRGEPTTRRGQLRQLTGVGSVHSVVRMNLPSSGSFMRFWGTGSNWQRGNTQGTLGVIESGFSGNPLTMLAYRPALTGDSWMIAADANKVRQAAATGAAISLGLAAPAVAVTAAIADILTTGIAAFDSSDGTDAATWTLTAGQDRSGNAAAAPTALDVGGVSGNAVAFTTAPGTVTEGYSSIIGRARALNLSMLGGGAAVAADDDLIHLWLNLDDPQLVEELRIYFVCSSGFDPAVVPGVDTAVNTDGFVKAIRPHDATGFFENTQSAVDAGDLARSRALLDSFLADSGSGLVPGTVEALSGGSGSVAPGQLAGDASLPTQASVQLVPGRGAWSEFGNIDRPLRRGEFIRFGNSAGRGWDTVTGIVIVIQTTAGSAVTLSCDDWFLTGGYPLDTTEPTSTPYDWRVTNYHTVTGDESNPSPIMADATWLECLRQRVNVQPVAYGNASVRQRVYRRGGTFGDDWGYAGQNTADGALFTDDASDAEVEAAGTLELDNDQPITTVNAAGATVRAQPLPVLFGPLEGILFGLGDPNRPGHLYYSKAGRSGSWPPDNHTEVCSPSEELMTGMKLGSQGFLLSRLKGYTVTANLVNGQIGVDESGCQVGICSRWAWCLGPKGAYFVSANAQAPGLYATAGGAAELLSSTVDSLFRGQTVQVTPSESLLPIDWTQANKIRLSIFQYVLQLHYQDTGGAMRMLCVDLLAGDWFLYDFADQPQMSYTEEPQSSAPALWLGTAGGNAHTYEGSTDNGVAVTARVVTGYLDAGRPREDKNLGDVVFDADVAAGQTLTVQTRLNNGVIENAQQAATPQSGRRRYQLDPFGASPQYARNVQLDIQWTAAQEGNKSLFMAGVAYTALPDQVLQRATTWESFPTEQYLTGVSLDVNTNGQTVELDIESIYQGIKTLTSAIVCSTPQRARVPWSWPVVKADMVRVHPKNDCKWLMLFGYQWLKQAEPPRVAVWDSNWENHYDTYYTGLDLEVDTFGRQKKVAVWVDQVQLTDPATGLPYFTITATGRAVVHLTFGPGRGHVYRFNALDANPGLLYGHRWHLEEEPSEQTNWNQNYTLAGTLTNKAVKGVLIEADTFGAAKTVQVQLDGAVAATLSVNHSGRQVQHYSFASATGRVLRLLPTDNNPSRLYSVQWVYDEEPLQLQRWETQRLTHGFDGQQLLYWAFLTLKSTVAVTLVVNTYNQNNLLVGSDNYAIPSTGGAKSQVPVRFNARRGVLFQYILTSDDGATRFLLYREESSVLVLPWGAQTAQTVKPFGSDDLDKVRQMGSASGIAQTPNNRPEPPLPASVGLMGSGENAGAEDNG